jgi:hypothetical protein
MIVSRQGDQLVLVRQVDHSMLSGWLAATWGAGPWEHPEPYTSCVVGARMHDVIWVPWDESLPRRADGVPYNFNEVQRHVILPYQKRGIDSVEALDPYAGLLVSLHFSGFYHSHWGWEFGSVEPEDAELVEAHVRDELERQRDLRRRLGLGAADERRLECNYKWLQMWDRISRDLCLLGFDAGYDVEQPPVPARVDGGQLSLRIRFEPGGVCRLDPYPLTVEPYRARIPCVRLPAAELDSLKGRWLAGGDDSIEVTFLSG